MTPIRLLLATLILIAAAGTADAGARRSRPTKTGQTLCYDTSDMVTSCAGTAQDGDLRRGENRSYLDNGDGTIRDKRTALTWEKLSDDGSIHDKDNGYSWAQAFEKIDDLNAAAFAGFTDWRLPSYLELMTLVDIGTSYPSTPAAFDSNCGDAATGNPGCTVLTCSCTKPNYGWTSSSNVDTPQYKWSVYFGTGSAAANLKTSPFMVRAVRGGS